MKVQKTISLTVETLAIAARMENFSGWIRARLRQYDEGVDLVSVEIASTMRLRKFATLHKAIISNDGSTALQILADFEKQMQNHSLGEYE